MLNKEKMIEILQNKIEEGYSIVESLKINDKEYGTAVMNMFETAKTIDQLKQEIAFDKEMSEKREMTNEEAKALEEITSKNEEVCL
jgi:hypothetical protein